MIKFRHTLLVMGAQKWFKKGEGKVGCLIFIYIKKYIYGNSILEEDTQYLKGVMYVIYTNLYSKQTLKIHFHYEDPLTSISGTSFAPVKRYMVLISISRTYTTWSFITERYMVLIYIYRTYTTLSLITEIYMIYSSLFPDQI